MVRSAVGVTFCLLVVASALSAGATASSALPAGQVAADYPEQPGKCNTARRASSDATVPNLTIIPHESTVAADEWGAAVICVVNPAGRNESVDLWLEVWYNGTAEDASLFLVGPDGRRPGGATQRVMSIDRRSNRGHAHVVDAGVLPPGTGTQYAVVVEAGADVRDYELRAWLLPRLPPNPDDWATIHVVESRCGWFCGVGRGVDATVAIFATGVHYLRTHPSVLVGFLTVLVGVGTLAAKVFSSKWFQTRVFGVEDGTEESREE